MIRQDITDTTEADYSVSQPLEDGITAVLAAVGVHRGGCEISFMRSLLPYISQSILLQKMQKQQEYLSYHDDLTGLMNRNSFVRYMSDVQKKEHKSLGAVSVDINGLKNLTGNWT